MERSRWDTVLVYFGMKEDTGSPSAPWPLWKRVVVLVLAVAVLVGLVIWTGWGVIAAAVVAVVLTTSYERYRRRTQRP